MRKYYIYFHKNPITKQIFYVGVGYNYRAFNFKWGRSKHYKNYINKHGLPIVILFEENLEENEAYNLEIKYIALYGRKGIDIGGILVNKSSGGKTSAKGTKQYVTEEWKKKIGDSNRGKKKHNIEGIKSISNKNSKIVVQFDLNNNFIKEWKSQWEASQNLNINYSSLNNCALGRSKTAGNFKWKLKYDN